MSDNSKQTSFYAQCAVSQNADHLLGTVGALYTRNKSLQKGHATLTRRVQELEALLGETQAAASPISHADTQLQQDLKDLQKRVNGLEDAGIYAFTSGGKGKHTATAVLEDAITRGISAALRPGGVLHNALNNR